MTPPPRRGRRGPVVALAVVLVLALAAGGFWLLRPGPDTSPLTGPAVLASQDTPGSTSLPLTEAFAGDGFTLQLPVGRQIGQPQTDAGGTRSLLTHMIGQSGDQTTLIVLLMPPDLTSARGALRRVAEESDSMTASGPVRDTAVGTTPAVARDFTVGTHLLREIRMEHGGRVYAVGILSSTAGGSSFDAALAALQTWTWT